MRAGNVIDVASVIRSAELPELLQNASRHLGAESTKLGRFEKPDYSARVPAICRFIHYFSIENRFTRGIYARNIFKVPLNFWSRSDSDRPSSPPPSLSIPHSGDSSTIIRGNYDRRFARRRGTNARGPRACLTRRAPLSLKCLASALMVPVYVLQICIEADAARARASEERSPCDQVGSHPGAHFRIRRESTRRCNCCSDNSGAGARAGRGRDNGNRTRLQ